MATEDVTTRLRPGCGTPGGYNTHRNHGETPCPWCREAHNLNTRLETSSTRAAVNRPLKARLFKRAVAEHADRFAEIRRKALAAMSSTEAS